MIRFSYVQNIYRNTILICNLQWVMLKDANDANNGNNMHNSYSGWATTASIINYHLLCHSVCVSLMRTMLTPEQYCRIMFGFNTCSVHDSKSVHLHTVLTAHNGSLSDTHHVLLPLALCTLYALHWRIQRAHDGLWSNPPVS